MAFFVEGEQFHLLQHLEGILTYLLLNGVDHSLISSKRIAQRKGTDISRQCSSLILRSLQLLQTDALSELDFGPFKTVTPGCGVGNSR